MANQLRQLVAQGHTEKAIEELLRLTNDTQVKHLNNQVIQLSARFKSYKKGILSGTTTASEQGVAFAKINSALLSLIEDYESALSGSSTPPDSPVPGSDMISHSSSPLSPAGPSKKSSIHTSKSALILGGVALLVLLGLLVGMVAFKDRLGDAGPLAEMLFILLLGIVAAVAFFEVLKGTGSGEGVFMGMKYHVSGPVFGGLVVAVLAYLFLQNTATGPFEFTIYLSPDPAQTISTTYPPLERSRMKLRLANESKWADINEDYEADFKNIAGDFQGDLVRVDIDGRYWELIENEVRLSGKSQQMLIQPNGSLARIYGKVRDGNSGKPLVNVRIEVQEVAAISNQDGNFSITIPLEKQRAEYQVEAYLDGYTPYKGTATPATGEPLPILLNQ